MNLTIRVTYIRAVAALLVLAAVAWISAGSLTPPPGPVAPTMKPLDHVEPRTPISSLPFVINNCGSYYLTGCLSGVSGQSGIIINAPSVDLDLGGFSISGVPAAQHGIELTAGPANGHVHIRHGKVAAWPGNGIHIAGSRCVNITDVATLANGGNGVAVTPSAASACLVISSSVASSNVADGFHLTAGGVITDSCADLNGDDGIDAAGATSIGRCKAGRNTDAGIEASDSTIGDCSAVANTVDGIRAGDSRVANCIATANGDNGIKLTGDSSASHNNCSGNGADGSGYGILAGGRHNTVEHNHLTGNASGLGTLMGDNVILDNTVLNNTDNYNFAAGTQLQILLSQIPESIDWPAHVRLAGSLTGLAGQNGITINADGVTIDLGGHILTGVAGSLDGISVPAAHSGLVVRNGNLKGWGGNGINNNLSDQSEYSDLRIASSGGVGLLAGAGTALHHVTVQGNTGGGLTTGSGCTLSACIARSNTGVGLDVGATSNLTDCVAESNSGKGLDAGSGCTIQHCTATFNGEDGIEASAECTVTHCTATRNTQNGINAGAHCLIVENQCENNGYQLGDGAGIYVSSSGCRIIGNNVTGNDRGIDVDLAGNLIIGNSARLNIIFNYSFVADNRYGPIIDIRAAGTPAFNGSSAASTVSSTDPWANFAY